MARRDGNEWGGWLLKGGDKTTGEIRPRRHGGHGEKEDRKRGTTKDTKKKRGSWRRHLARLLAVI